MFKKQQLPIADFQKYVIVKPLRCYETDIHHFLLSYVLFMKIINFNTYLVINYLIYA